MSPRRRLALLKRQTEELVVLDHRFLVHMTRRTTYDVRTTDRASGAHRRVKRGKDVLVDVQGRPLRGRTLRTEHVSSGGELKFSSDIPELAKARAELVAVLRLPLLNLMNALDVAKTQAGIWERDFFAKLFGPMP